MGMRGTHRKINAYKQNILENGESITMSDRRYRFNMMPSKRLTFKYGHLIEELRNKKGVKTGETKEHMRYATQIVRV